MYIPPSLPALLADYNNSLLWTSDDLSNYSGLPKQTITNIMLGQLDYADDTVLQRLSITYAQQHLDSYPALLAFLTSARDQTIPAAPHVLASLPKFVIHLLQLGHTYDEIAHILDTTPQNVSRTLRYTRNTFRVTDDDELLQVTDHITELLLYTDEDNPFLIQRFTALWNHLQQIPIRQDGLHLTYQYLHFPPRTDLREIHTWLQHIFPALDINNIATHPYRGIRH